jgi:2-dehydro-3-deoxyphosphooctonate aldolase (KDO 8-P synthase)
MVLRVQNRGGVRLLYIGSIPIGDGAPLALITGLNVLEDEQDAIEFAATLQELAERHAIPMIFKASWDKANRTRRTSYRGPGLDEGIQMLRLIKRETDLPILTDVHEPEQAKRLSEVVDCLQIPAFLCRQTDLIRACAATNLPINVKKGQFLAPQDVPHIVDKIDAWGDGGVMMTERGTSHGYNDLLVDMRGLAQMREFAPVCFDATHAAQYPSAGEGCSGGDRRFVAPLARAAVATGVDALFVEAHPDIDSAPCDGPCQIDIATLDLLICQIKAIDTALRGIPEALPV